MTITAQPAKTGPYDGNGTTTVFSYTFEVQSETHLVVTVLGADGSTESVKVLNTDYTVTGVDNPAGGTIVMGTAPSTGEKLTITRDVTLDQEVDLQNRGAVNPETLETSLDKLTQIAQDQQAQIDRALKVDLFEQADLDELTINVNALAAIEGDISTVANISPDVTTVAGIDAEVTTVAGVSTDVATVSGISADVTTVADDGTDIGVVAGLSTEVSALGPISADITTVAGISSDVTEVSGISSDVTAVSGISADVTTVAADGTDIGVVAGISSDVTTVAADGTDIGVVAGISSDVTTVSGISADVTTVAADGTDIGVVAGISADITTVSGISTDVTTVAADGTDIGVVAGISSDITTVAADATDIGTVATNISDVTTTSSISADITTVSGISADVTTVASNLADVTNFADVYLGPSASDPTTRNDGSALKEGDLYFNTTSDEVRTYEGTSWVAAFVSLSGALLSSNNLSDVNDPDAALSNLGLMATSAELNTLDGITASTADLNKTTGIEAGADVTDAGNVNPLVDAHLNQSTATADQVLTWDGSDYAWEDASSGVTQSTADWEEGTSTDEGIVSPAKVAASAEVNSPVKAWVNFDGTATVSIRESFNVSSITDNGTGDYTVNFATALVDANYALGGSALRGTGTALGYGPHSSFSTTSVRVVTEFYNTSNSDSELVSVIVVGG